MTKATSKYNNAGLYNGYDKNHKERDALDFYATPTAEVENILNTMHLDLDHTTILEPCCGDGHMVQGIVNYCYNNYDSKLWKLKATDIMKRDSILRDCDWEAGNTFDFLSDNYPYAQDIDYVIMNPPFKLIEPFVMKALGIADKGVLCLGRIQFLEGKSRYENILAEFPPSDVYVYVDRIYCYPNGDENVKQASAQCYAWFYWDMEKINFCDKYYSNLHWIRRV